MPNVRRNSFNSGQRSYAAALHCHVQHKSHVASHGVSSRDTLSSNAVHLLFAVRVLRSGVIACCWPVKTIRLRFAAQQIPGSNKNFCFECAQVENCNLLLTCSDTKCSV